MTDQTFQFGVIILAAGRSTRMGRPKLLLPWPPRTEGGNEESPCQRHTSILGHQVENWKKLGVAQLVIVHAAGDSALEAELDRLGIRSDRRVVNSAPERGMFSSIRCAAEWPGWKAELTHFVITLGDQPHLRVGTLRQLLWFASTELSGVVQPRYLGRLGHPVILPRAAFVELQNNGASCLRGFLGEREVAACELDDPGLHLDIDTPVDYDKARQLHWRE